MSNPQVISFPVIDRELRVQARRPATYYSRLWWGLAAVAVLGLVTLNAAYKIERAGYLFAVIHASIATMLLLLSPIVAADAISRERREGTLGLLFLTPLNARQITVGKFFTHIFRVFYFGLLMVPFLMLPVLVGGVTLEQFLTSIGLLFAILINGVAAGLIASACCVRFGSALLWSLFLAAFANMAVIGFATNLPFMTLAVKTTYEWPLFVHIFLLPPYFVFLPTSLLEMYQAAFTTPFAARLISPAMLVASILFLRFAVLFCTRRIARYAEMATETERSKVFRRKFLTPVLWKDAFRRGMSRRLDKNPFLWLEFRAAWARAARWILLLILLGVETSFVMDDSGFTDFLDMQLPMLCVLLAAMTLKSATSFQYEKENGAFELILLAPVTEKNLVAGRLRAVMQYYLPLTVSLALFNLIGLFWFEDVYSIHELGPALNLLSLWLSFVSIPAAGLFFALRFHSFLWALFGTLAVAIFGAPLLWGAINNMTWYAANRLDFSLAYLLEETMQTTWWPFVCLVILYHMFAVVICRRQAVKILQRRSFAFQKAG